MWIYGPYEMMGYSHGAMMLFGGIFWLTFVALAVWGITRLAPSHRQGGLHATGNGKRSPGLDILEERYAKGEIERDEYLQKKRDMTG